MIICQYFYFIINYIKSCFGHKIDFKYMSDENETKHNLLLTKEYKDLITFWLTSDL